jgi:shikimate kinase
MKIFLVGYRCTGKTTIGELLADSIHFSFIDIDKKIEQESGSTIAQIVENHGWEQFRFFEKEALFNTINNDNIVVATGGGIVVDKENLNFMTESGFCIWLDADIKTILKRLEHDVKTLSLRPSLTKKGLIDETRELLKLREPLYKNCSHKKIDTTHKTAEQIVDILAEEIKKCQAAP